MSTQRVYRGGRPRAQGNAEDPLVTVNLQVRQRQLAVLDQLADAEHTSRAALVREAIDLLLKRLKLLLKRVTRLHGRP
jgi:Ribbon-helix-helix protein, copG family